LRAAPLIAFLAIGGILRASSTAVSRAPPSGARSTKSKTENLYRSSGYTLAFRAWLGIGNECLELFVTQPLLVRSFHRWPDLSDLRPLVGNRGDGIPYFLHGDGRGRGFYCQMPPSWKRATPLVL